MNAEPTPNYKPDWRLRLALTILEDGGYATRNRDGQLVQRTVRFVRKIRDLVSDKAIDRAIRGYPDIFTAMQLIRGMGPSFLELKARALAGQTAKEIAQVHQLPVETVVTFLDLVFDVQHRLTASQWIVQQAIGVNHAEQLTTEQVMLLHIWKRGVAVLPAWLDFLRHRGEPHDLRSESGRQRARIQLLIDVQQLPDEAMTSEKLCRIHPFLLGNSIKTVPQCSIRAAISRNRAQILNDLCDFAPARAPNLEAFVDTQLGNVPIRCQVIEFVRAA